MKKSRGKGKLKRPRDVTNEEVEERERATKIKKESTSDHETDNSEHHVFDTGLVTCLHGNLGAVYLCSCGKVQTSNQ